MPSVHLTVPGAYLFNFQQIQCFPADLTFRYLATLSKLHLWPLTNPNWPYVRRGVNWPPLATLRGGSEAPLWLKVKEQGDGEEVVGAGESTRLDGP